ncbi:hypothetical protein NONI108955_21695 [Nocardia ninae]|uniref:Uncharacterized protein n=1 Tax=Nocardia ninae NBRC 108245 TaxID=1210091 RepID=A0A511M7E1_9NOCA|nr:hypothetical protein [Nocardia ninae]GEM36501.1 hypothetical protein NN4_10200 [Nocardia ninae NBRC 108245]
MSIWFAAALVVAAVTLTYFCCIRPMRRGSCRVGAKPAGVERELAELRADLRSLREQDGTESTSESR